MKLGILVNTAQNLPLLNGITKAAIGRGHEIIIFAMDEGTRLLTTSQFKELSGLAGVQASFCDHSAKELEVDTSGLPASIVAGSQYNNADMNHQADKVLVL
ncbi:MAG: hypothetical protein P8130_03145 [Deltaproteobacteria bacterium]